ncbi:MAG: TIGR03960 family B12-binding radical SAM protein [Clostridia bacterium]|nr:TIGR03960 family B12-binding radical SAM protein [Clostridia bacterium]
MKVELNALKSLLLKVEKPSRYTGGEYGARVYSGNADGAEAAPFKFCACFPDLYEVGMSNLGIKIVAESFLRKGYVADLCYAPYKDFGAGLKELGVPLYSLGLKKPLAEFDMLGFSLQYELCYTNLLYMLDLAGIPLLRKDRKGGNYPLIAVGGPCAVNPEPLADFVDVVFIGDGEQTDVTLAEIYVQCGGATKEFYEKASKIDGVYFPELTEVKYNEDGTVAGFEGITKVKRAIVSDLDGAVFPMSQPVPNCESVFDRSVIEVMRGCYRGCRFCQAGFIYRPVRKRGVNTLTEQACSLIASTGYEEVSLNSLSTGDYPHLKELLTELKSTLPKGVSLALPSLRVDSFDGEFAQDARKISLTFAPEAGTQRLRDVINKDVTEDEILRAVNSAFDAGYSAVKLYFMLGLPTETDEDLKGIRHICDLIKGAYSSKPRKKALRISVSVSTFIPKPFTPFQWEAQASAEEIDNKHRLLRDTLFVRGVSLSTSHYFTSLLEAVLARGDRRLGKTLLSAYRNGCIFDGWIDDLNVDGWKRAFEECGTDTAFYTRERPLDEILPWDFIDVGVTRSFYARERANAYAGKVSGSCKKGCGGCGLANVCEAAKEKR